MANMIGAKPIVFQRTSKRFLVQCPTTYGEAVEKARRVFKYAQDDALSLSCVADDGEKAQIYPDAWECLVPTMLVVYVDKEDNDEGGGTVVPTPNQPQSPKIECELSVSEAEPPSSEAEEEVGGLEEIDSSTAADEEEQYPTPPSPSLVQDPDEQIIVVIQFCASDSTTREQQYKLRRRTKIFKAFNRFEMDIGCDRKEMVYFFNGKVIGRNQCVREIGIQHGDTIRAVQVA